MLLFVSIVAELIALIRFARMAKTYPIFTAFISVTLIQDVGFLIAWPPSERAYLHVWYAGGVLRLGLVVAIFFEAARLLRGRFPGIEITLARLAMITAAVAMVFATASSLDLIREFPGKYAVLYAIMRYSSSAFLLVALMLGLWTAWFPVGVSENLRRHTFLLCGYFSSQCLAMILLNTSTKWLADYVSVLMAAAFYIAWAVLINPDGEATSEAGLPVKRPVERAGDRERIHSNLARGARVGT
jgi:hypothetical protein